MENRKRVCLVLCASAPGRLFPGTWYPMLNPGLQGFSPVSKFLTGLQIMYPNQLSHLCVGCWCMDSIPILFLIDPTLRFYHQLRCNSVGNRTSWWGAIKGSVRIKWESWLGCTICRSVKNLSTGKNPGCPGYVHGIGYREKPWGLGDPDM